MNALWLVMGWTSPAFVESMMRLLTLSARLRSCAAAMMVLGAAANFSMSGARAGDDDVKAAAAADTPDAVKNGELVFHGNYCGLGNRKGADPIDALDAACMRHDACTPSGKVPSCACNARLVEEAGAIMQDPAQSAELKALASLTGTAAAAGMVLCGPAVLVAPQPVAPQPVAPAAPLPLDPPLPRP